MPVFAQLPDGLIQVKFTLIYPTRITWNKNASMFRFWLYVIYPGGYKTTIDPKHVPDKTRRDALIAAERLVAEQTGTQQHQWGARFENGALIIVNKK